MKCMFSCGTTAEKRKQDIENILEGKEEEDYLLCTDTDDDDDTLTEGENNKANAIRATISAGGGLHIIKLKYMLTTALLNSWFLLCIKLHLARQAVVINPAFLSLIFVTFAYLLANYHFSSTTTRYTSSSRNLLLINFYCHLCFH